MLDTYEVLQQIAGYWDKMTNAEKASLAIDLAKKTQMDTFLAVMSNFESAEKAYTTALLAEGSAWKENAAYMESIEAHQAQLKQQWSTLVLSMPFEDLERALLDAGTALLKFANSDMGTAIIQASALTGGFVLLKTVIMSDLIPALTKLGAAALSNPIFLGTAALAGIIYAFDKLHISFDEASESLEKLNDQITEQDSEVKSLEEHIDNISKRIGEINELKVANPEDLDALKREEESLNRELSVAKGRLAVEKATLEVLQKQAQIEANKLKNKQDKKYNVYNFEENPELEKEGSLTVKTGGVGEALAQQMTNIENFKTRVHEAEVELDALKAAGEGTSKKAVELGENIDYFNGILIEEEKSATETANTLNEITAAGATLDDSMQSALNTYNEYYGALEDTANVAGMAEEEIDALAEQYGEAADAAENMEQAVEQTTQALSNIEDSYSTVSKAVEEFNEQGGFSAKTIGEITKLEGNWLEVLNGVINGELDLNEASQALAEVEKQEAIATLQAQAAQDMMNIAIGKYTEVSPIAQTAISDLKSKTEEEGKAAKEAAANELLYAAAINARKYAAEHGGYGDDTQGILNMIDAVEGKYASIIEKMNNWSLSAGSTASKSAKKAAGDHKDAWLEAFKEEKDALENLLETDQITQYEYYQRLQELNEKYFGEISGKHEKYIKEYRENEEEIYKGTKEVYDKVRDYLAKAVEQGYEKAINALKKEEKAVLDEIKKQINALKKEKDNVLKGIKKEIDELKKQKEAVQEYYNKQIDKIKEENSVLQEQNELLEYQQKLQQAKAQRVMVMENGKFTLTENESAVAQAEQALADYQDQISYEQSIQEIEDLRDTQVEALEDQIEALEEYYTYMEEWYDSRIEQMEEYYEQVEENYEKQIEALQNELDTFKEGLQKEEDLENARLAAQVLGMNERKNLYEEELENLKNYINEVNRMLASLGEAGVSVDYSYSPITGYHTGTAEVAAIDASISTRASGDASFKEDSVALVGESPNTELLLGSKINSLGGGELMHLHKGTGIVNAESTSTLAGLLNGLATPQTNVANNRTTQQNFSFGNISLPNVTNADSFVNALSKQFNSYAIQYGNVRK